MKGFNLRNGELARQHRLGDAQGFIKLKFFHGVDKTLGGGVQLEAFWDIEGENNRILNDEGIGPTVMIGTDELLRLINFVIKKQGI